ncbi:HD-domain/PDEase-like protein [Anaeromyces robustus]|uniref:Phosphodiesterase n=1 Tax=Anaeromyces robustus TaxID=1754192 RepID=A0A1Y1WVB2_9FUNG|nr:HD-domain/PDEase-like protein [Anaeromyces robustus]|eukprot:ORX77499.1 HD-domain/PDEase-like protein [Anaeromyces robustus]
MIKFSENELEGIGIDFDSFKWSISELFGIILGMFNKYDAIKNETSLVHLLKFIANIRSTYNDVPYHTFRHAADVCFVTYYMFTELRSNIYLKYSRLEIIGLLISALGHDMYHPGYNNLFQINTKSELAIKYNNKSVLEQYSADSLVELIESSDILHYLNIIPDLDEDNSNSSENSSSTIIPGTLNEGNNKENNNNDQNIIARDIVQDNDENKNISHRFDNVSKEPIVPKALELEFNLLDKEVTDGLKTAEDVKNIKYEKIKKHLCDLVIEVILNTDMSTHFQLQDELSEISLTLNPSSECFFTMENDVDNGSINNSGNIHTNTNTLTSLSSVKGTNIDLSSQMAVYEEEEFINMEEPIMNNKSQVAINSTEFKENSNNELLALDDRKKDDAFDYCPESLSGYSNFENYTIQNQSQNQNQFINNLTEISNPKKKSDLEIYQLELSLRLLERKQYQLLSEKQRRTILNGLLHAADISNAARPWYVCEAWSNRVVEEFWRQGDEEKRLNLTVSPNMDRDRFERNGISIAFNDFITTPFYEVIYELIPTFEIFVKLLHINRQKWNDLVALSKTSTSESSIINALDSHNNSCSELSISISNNSLDDIRPMVAEPNSGRRLSIAAGTLIIPDNFLSKISIRNDYQRSLSVQSDHYPKNMPILNISRVSSSYLALNDSNSHINELGRSRSKDSHSDIPEKYIISQSTQIKKLGSLNTSDSMEKLGSNYRNRRCQSVDTTYTRNT